MKDARELFKWEDNQKALAIQLWLTPGNSDAATQTHALLDSLASFILTGYSSDEFSSSLVQYLAVLGINTQTNRLRTAKNFSYMLAGVPDVWPVTARQVMQAALGEAVKDVGFSERAEDDLCDLDRVSESEAAAAWVFAWPNMETLYVSISGRCRSLC